MMDFLPVRDVQLVWQHSPIVRAAAKTLRYLVDMGPIGLTASKALKRSFVEWAAEVFEWPGYGVADLYASNKVLNEHHFPPLVVLHDLLLATRLARHERGHLAITGFGRTCAHSPIHLWKLLAGELLFNTDHGRYTHEGLRFDGDWEMILEVLNVTVDAGASERQICDALLHEAGEEAGADSVVQLIIYMNVLRPLTWAGLLAEIGSTNAAFDVSIYVKTPLWMAALALPSDAELSVRALH